MPRVMVNGRPRVVASSTTLAQLLDVLGAPHRGVAVAVDADVVPRGAWDTFMVPDGARVEILTAVRGG